jgi:hypothetical protein
VTTPRSAHCPKTEVGIETRIKVSIATEDSAFISGLKESLFSVEWNDKHQMTILLIDHKVRTSFPRDLFFEAHVGYEEPERQKRGQGLAWNLLNRLLYRSAEPHHFTKRKGICQVLRDFICSYSGRNCQFWE